MTVIKVRYGRDAYRIVSSGHAGSSRACTAVSAIIQALAGWVRENRGHARLEKGKAVISFPKSEGAAAVMDLMLIGLLQIQKAVPTDVHVEITCSEQITDKA